MKVSVPLKTFFGLLFGATVLYLLKNYTILPITMVALGVLSLLIPGIANIIDRFISLLLNIIGSVISTLLLFLSFYFVLAPIALIAKMFGKKDSLRLKQPTGSNFVEVNKSFEKKGFEKSFFFFQEE